MYTIKDYLNYYKDTTIKDVHWNAMDNLLCAILIYVSAPSFSSKKKINDFFEYVNNYKEYYPYEEERRLFYVALTRCKKKVFLFVPKNNESIFIKELKRYKNVIIREK